MSPTFCLVSADSAVAGCISRFCRRSSSGRLDTEHEEMRIRERMPVEVEEYFRELLSIAHAVISEMEE